MGLRVSEEEEIEGLDYAEHGMHAYDLAGATGLLDSLGSPGHASTRVATSLATSEN